MANSYGTLMDAFNYPVGKLFKPHFQHIPY